MDIDKTANDSKRGDLFIDEEDTRDIKADNNEVC
jgi:hypothetical protein